MKDSTLPLSEVKDTTDNSQQQESAAEHGEDQVPEPETAPTVMVQHNGAVPKQAVQHSQDSRDAGKSKYHCRKRFLHKAMAMLRSNNYSTHHPFTICTVQIWFAIRLLREVCALRHLYVNTARTYAHPLGLYGSFLKVAKLTT